jgi:hypothetical protein
MMASSGSRLAVLLLLQILADKGFAVAPLAAMQTLIEAKSRDRIDGLAHVATDAVADLGKTEEIGQLFAGFQRTGYEACV